MSPPRQRQKSSERTRKSTVAMTYDNTTKFGSRR